MSDVIRPVSQTLLQFIDTAAYKYQFHPPFEVIVYSKTNKRSKEFKMAHLPELNLWGLGFTLYQAIDNLKYDVHMLLHAYVTATSDAEAEKLNDHYANLRKLLKERTIFRKNEVII